MRKSYKERASGSTITASVATLISVFIPSASGGSFDLGAPQAWLLISAGVTVVAATIGFRINSMRTSYEAGS